MSNPPQDVAGLAGELTRLHNEARGREFDLVPADGPIARLALFMHEHGDRIVAALEQQALALSLVREEWQPIKTATKDGMFFDAWTDAGRRIPDAWWDRGSKSWFCDLGPKEPRELNEIFPHWKPLPAPPDDGEGGPVATPSHKTSEGGDDA